MAFSSTENWIYPEKKRDCDELRNTINNSVQKDILEQLVK